MPAIRRSDFNIRAQAEIDRQERAKRAKKGQSKDKAPSAPPDDKSRADK